MSKVFYHKVGNLSPSISATLKDADGNAINFTGALGVTFSMWDSSGSVIIDGKTASFVDASAGQVEYQWDAEDVGTPGTYTAAFKVTYSDGTTESFPRNDWIIIDLAPLISDWTYGGAPETDTDAGERDSVRFLTGDTDHTDKKVSDAEIAFAISQTDDIYQASGLIARTLASKYASMVDQSFESMKVSYSHLQDKYLQIASNMETLSIKHGSPEVGLPSFGGVSLSDMESNNEDTDINQPEFRIGMFTDKSASDPN